MKANPFMIIISVFIGSLIFYGFYSSSDSLFLSLAGALLTTAALAFTLGINIVDRPRGTVMFKVLACIMFIILLAVNTLFIWLRVTEGTSIVTNGLLGAGGAIGLYLIYKSDQ